MAVVLAPADKKGDRYLCAYIVSDMELTASELKGFSSIKLPDYMIPAYFVPLESIPLTPNGKIDRKALPEPKIKPGEVDTASYTPPGNKTEEKLSGIWAEVLEIEKEVIGIDSSFFELGGHSLKATVMISKIHRALNVILPVAEVF